MRIGITLIVGVVIGYLFTAWFSIPNFLTNGLDSGVSALLGALIGAGTTALVSIWQLNAQFRKSRESTIYDAKRTCYIEATAHFSKISTHLGEGRAYPVEFSDAEKDTHHQIMSNLLLMSSPEVNKHRLEYLKAFPEGPHAFPTTELDREIKYQELKQIQILMRKAMRKEPGLE